MNRLPDPLYELSLVLIYAGGAVGIAALLIAIGHFVMVPSP